MLSFFEAKFGLWFLITLNLFQNQIIMKTTTDFNANHVILADLGKLAHYQEPVRCNHLIIILCRKGEISIEINYVTYALKENGLLVLKPLDIVMLKDGSDDFDCIALMLPVSSLTPILQDIDITNIKHLAQNPIIYHSEESLLFVKQSFSLLVYAKNIVGYAGFEKIAEKQVASLFYMHDHNNNRCNEYGNKGTKEPYSRKKELFRKFVKGIIGSHTVSREVLFYANELGVSSGYLNEICKEVSSHSAKDIIDSAVIARLKYELSYTTKSIQELADEYNFPSQSYFSRYYKRMTGVTPSEFRQARADK